MESDPDQTDAKKSELKKIRNILVFFSEDARVIDDSIREEKPRELKEVTEAVPEAEEKKVELNGLTVVKKEKDMCVDRDWYEFLVHQAKLDTTTKSNKFANLEGQGQRGRCRGPRV